MRRAFVSVIAVLMVAGAGAATSHDRFAPRRLQAWRAEGPAGLQRLLGKLDTELSCANSRFFRTTLYPDPRVAGLMRDKFVLHWSSERPVPVITVDFGDGRVMKRTVTGNSVHYVLAADGRPLDALPGLYGAAEFVQKLTNALDLAAESPSDARLRAWHAAAARKLQLEPPPAPPVQEPLVPEVIALARAKAAPPDARLAGQLRSRRRAWKSRSSAP